MADLTITAAGVQKVGTPATVTGIAGVTIMAGQAVYFDLASATWLLATDGGTEAQSGYGSQLGIAQNGALAGQPITVQTGGQITIGATVVIGTLYVVSAAVAGNIAPLADLASTNRLTFLGLAISASVLDMSYAKPTGIALP